MTRICFNSPNDLPHSLLFSSGLLAILALGWRLKVDLSEELAVGFLHGYRERAFVKQGRILVADFEVAACNDHFALD